MKIEDKNIWQSFNKKSDSNSINEKCPSDILLAGYIDNNLSDEENYIIEEHILSCDKCLEIIKSIKIEEIVDFKIDKTLMKNVSVSINKAIKTKTIKFPLSRKFFAIAASLIFVMFFMVLSSANKSSSNSIPEKIDTKRIVQLYNNNKYYRIDLNSKDGFAPEMNFNNRAISTCHPADNNKDGKISMNEVLQYISLEKKNNKTIASK